MEWLVVPQALTRVLYQSSSGMWDGTWLIGVEFTACPASVSSPVWGILKAVVEILSGVDPRYEDVNKEMERWENMPEKSGK
jgi:hypothetical protein